MKRDRIVPVRMNDDEYAALENLERIYSFDGARATKSFLVRYALKRLPHQTPAFFIP